MENNLPSSVTPEPASTSQFDEQICSLCYTGYGEHAETPMGGRICWISLSQAKKPQESTAVNRGLVETDLPKLKKQNKKWDSLKLPDDGVTSK